MKTLVKSRLPSVVALLALLLMAVPVSAADDGKAREGATQVESGAKQIRPRGAHTAKGTPTAGDKIKEAGRAAEPEAKSAWTKTRDGAVSFGRSVRAFFTRLFE